MFRRYFFGKKPIVVIILCLILISISFFGLIYESSKNVFVSISNVEIANYTGVNYIKTVPLFYKEIAEDSILQMKFNVSYKNKENARLSFVLSGCITEILIEAKEVDINAKKLDSNGFGFEKCNNEANVDINVSDYLQPNKKGIVSIVYFAQKPASKIVFKSQKSNPWLKLFLLLAIIFLIILVFILI